MHSTFFMQLKVHYVENQYQSYGKLYHSYIMLFLTYTGYQDHAPWQ